MNFLGHCLFSAPTPAALAGSLWPDFGRKPLKSECSATFLEHFDRHQRIDRFTDRHASLEPLRSELRPVFRKTTPVIVDMLLDHFLANHWPNYHPQPLTEFAAHTYRQLQAFNELIMPERMVQTLGWMQANDWLVSYRSEAGIKRALSGLAKRIRFANPIVEQRNQALTIYRANKDELAGFLVHLKTHIDAP